MKNILLSILFSFSFITAKACDVCGCSVGGSYFGILPQYHRHVVGLRWYDARLETTHPADHSGLESASSDRVRSMEFWGRWYPLPRVQVLGSMPLHFLESVEGNVTTANRGPGDATLLLNYLAVQRNTGNGWRQQLQLGGGVKMPTGHYNRSLDHPTLQTGTGSWDALFNAMYTLRYRNIGLNTDAMYRLTGTNSARYQFGNRFSGGARLFYWKEWKRFSLLPNGGIVYESAAKDFHHGDRLDFTGGTCTLATLGVDLYFNKLSLGATFKTPLHQHLAEGRVRAQNRVVFNLSWIF